MHSPETHFGGISFSTAREWQDVEARTFHVHFAYISQQSICSALPLYSSCHSITVNHSVLEISLINVVWTYETFENNFGIDRNFHTIFEGEL